MSKATKKRFVTKKLESELVLPKEDESIARVVASVGRDLHEVIDAEGEKYLVSMPPRFRTTVYIRRGHFVYLTRIDEGDKVKGEITHVLDNETICYCMEQNVWPKRFEEEALMLTRRPTAKDSNIIDEDMLPPLSDSGDSDDSTGGQSVSDRDDEEPSMYNPNRVI